MDHSCRLYCVLSAGILSCYFTPEEIEAKVPPTLGVAIDKVWTASKSHNGGMISSKSGRFLYKVITQRLNAERLES